jgi:hypothetical protein
VNSSTFLILETDQTQIGTGVFELQSASSSGASAQVPASLLRPAFHARVAKQKKSN